VTWRIACVKSNEIVPLLPPPAISSPPHSRDAWFCILALVISQSALLFAIRYAAQVSQDFDQWWASSFGTGVLFLVQDVLWLFVALWFSGTSSVRNFVERCGLRRGITPFGWVSAWVAIAIALIDAYGGSKGWTAASKIHHASDPAHFSLSSCYFVSFAVITPFSEEVVTRGFLFPTLRQSYRFAITAFIIIGFSAYFHWDLLANSLFTFGCLGALWILLCIVREKTGSLWDCLLCHAAFNSIALLDAV